VNSHWAAQAITHERFAALQSLSSRFGGIASAGYMPAKLLRDKQLIRKLLKLPPHLGRFYHCKDSEEISDET
jgi:hypothetical protein